MFLSFPDGCVLSPCLFSLYTEVIFRGIDGTEGLKIGGIHIANLRYADDTFLLAESEEQPQKILDRVNEVGIQVGMKMNAKKTKTIVISKDEVKPKIDIMVDGTGIQQVAKFMYLGQLIIYDGKYDMEVTRRIEIARGTFRKISKVLTRREMNITTRK